MQKGLLQWKANVLRSGQRHLLYVLYSNIQEPLICRTLSLHSQLLIKLIGYLWTVHPFATVHMFCASQDGLRKIFLCSS